MDGWRSTDVSLAPTQRMGVSAGQAFHYYIIKQSPHSKALGDLGRSNVADYLDHPGCNWDGLAGLTRDSGAVVETSDCSDDRNVLWTPWLRGGYVVVR